MSIILLFLCIKCLERFPTLRLSTLLFGHTLVSEFSRSTNLLHLGSTTFSVMWKWGSLCTETVNETSACTNWKTHLSKIGRERSSSQISDHDWSWRSFSFCSTGCSIKYGSRKARGDKSFFRQWARCLRIDSTVCRGCWRVTRRYFCKALASDGKTDAAASCESRLFNTDWSWTLLMCVKASSAAVIKRARRFFTRRSYSCSS